MAINPKNIEREFDLDIIGATFRVTETGNSRELGTNNTLIYDVRAYPHTDIPFTDSIEWGGTPQVAEELIIAANVWHFAGWTHVDNQLSKKWPPRCTRMGANQYQVSIDYDQLFVVNFQVGQNKTQVFYSDDVSVLKWDENGFYVIYNIESLTPSEQLGYHAMHVTHDADGKPKVNGIDTIDGAFQWTERWTYGPIKSLMPPGETDIKKRYDYVMSEMTGRVNLTEFRGFPALSVRYEGGVGRNTSPLTWEFDHRFAFKPERSYHNIGGYKAEFDEKFRTGWVHVEFGDKEVRETTDRKLISIPEYIKGHVFCKTGKFEDLHIGEKIPLGYGTPFDEKFLPDGVPTIGTPWKLWVWANKT